MQFDQLSHLMEEHSRELRLEADRHRLLRAATPTFRNRLARALRAWASRLEPVRDVRPEQQFFGTDQFGHGASNISLDGAAYALNDH